jgi:hypothetical protein
MMSSISGLGRWHIFSAIYGGYNRIAPICGLPWHINIDGWQRLNGIAWYRV